MTVDDLLNFIHTEQDNEEVTVEYCESVIERFEPSESGHTHHLLSLDGTMMIIMISVYMYCINYRTYVQCLEDMHNTCICTLHVYAHYMYMYMSAIFCSCSVHCVCVFSTLTNCKCIVHAHTHTHTRVHCV